MYEGSSLTTHDQLKELVEDFSTSAGSTLVIGETEVLNASQQVSFLAQEQLEQLPELEQFDFVLIQNLIEKLPCAKGEHIIAQVRDCHAREMVLLVPIGTDWKENESCWQPASLISLGMNLIAEFEQENKPIHAYYYAVETYKKIPDWLNNKHWANPELFNKYRW